MDDLSFLAPPDEVLDWRRVVLTATALRNGLLGELPGSTEEIAARLSIDTHGVRILLDALAVWEVVVLRDESYGPGVNFPTEANALTINQHAAFMQRWGSQLDDRLDDPVIENHPPRPPGALGAWLGALATNAQHRAPEILDYLFEQCPEAETVLDLAGGHGEYGLEAATQGKAVTLLDLPEVIEEVSGWESLRDSGVELFAGDIYGTKPTKMFDLVLCFGFSHTQPASKLTELFTNIASVTSPGGSVAIHTFVRNQGPVPSLFAVQMLLAGRRGDTHELREYTAALEAAGFETPLVAALGDRTLILARKPQ